MRVQHQTSESQGKFFIEKNAEEVAAMTYTNDGKNQITINHTEVNDQLQGEGIGHKLVEVAVDYARKNEIKIVPLCPFVKSIFEANKEDYQDVRL